MFIFKIRHFDSVSAPADTCCFRFSSFTLSWLLFLLRPLRLCQSHKPLQLMRCVTMCANIFSAEQACVNMHCVYVCVHCGQAFPSSSSSRAVMWWGFDERGERANHASALPVHEYAAAGWPRSLSHSFFRDLPSPLSSRSSPCLVFFFPF